MTSQGTLVRTILIVFYLALTSVVLSQQTFSYSPPLCEKTGTHSAVLSNGWATGGTFFDAGGSGLPVNPQTGAINLVNAAPGTYTIMYAGPTTATAVIQVHPQPSVSVAGMSVCANMPFPVTLTANPTSGLSYTWMSNGSTNPTLSVTSPFFQTTLTAQSPEGCIRNISVEVKVYSSLAPVIVGNSSICIGSTSNLVATQLNGISSYTWSSGGSGAVVTINPTVTTVYSIKSIDTRGCSATVFHTVNVISVPSFSVKNVNVCAGTQATLSVIGQNLNNVNFVWQPGSYRGQTITVVPVSSSTFIVTGNYQGCNLAKGLAVSIINPSIPSVGFTYPLPVCAGQQDAMPIKFPGFTAGGSFHDVSDSAFVTPLPLDTVSGRIDLKQLRGGTYIIEYAVPAMSVTGKGCMAAASSTAILSVIEPAKLKVSPEITITEGESAQLSVTGGDGYFWQPSSWLSCYQCQLPVATPPVTTEYCVSAVTSGCYAEACTTVNVVCFTGNDRSVPTGFTPNNDGTNDMFCLRGWKRCNTLFNVKIFNRWGALLFESDDPDFCWDGTVGGVLQDADVYVFSIKAAYEGQGEFIKSGNVTLIR